MRRSPHRLLLGAFTLTAVLAALPAIALSVPEVEWHVVGQGGALGEFRERVAASSCADRIHLHGFLPDEGLQRLYRRCRVFAMPSFGEGFGIVYLEAMQQGCVPVGSTLDAAPEVIGDGGVCVDPTDPPSLERAVIGLLTESDVAFAARSERARARAAVFSPERFRTNLLAALDQVLTSNRAGRGGRAL